jgi:hypothetical protein
MKHKMLKTRVEPTPQGYQKPIPLGYYFGFVVMESYYFFVLCSRVLIRSSQHDSRTHLSGPVSMVVKFKLKFKFNLNSS